MKRDTNSTTKTIMTVGDVAEWLKMSKGQVYEMTSTRTRSGAMRDGPIPFVKINGNVRFIKEDLETWITSLIKNKAGH